MFLGYLLPYSTGCEHFLLQNYYRDTTEESSSTLEIETMVYSMPLEERMFHSIRCLSPRSFGEIDTILDPYLDDAFHTFLDSALAPILAGKPYHREEVDLLHILAMTIHPKPTSDRIPEALRPQSSAGDTIYWAKTGRLVNTGQYGMHFQLNYGHRVKIIEIILRNLILPSLEEDSPDIIYPLLHGAVPHLLAALQAFAVGAHNEWDTHLAHCGMATIAVQTNNLRIIEDTWDSLLHLMVDDKNNYRCDRCATKRCQLAPWAGHIRSTNVFELNGEEEVNFCPHSARGQLLACVLARSCQSRDHVDPALLHKFTTSLTDAVEWQVYCWTERDNEGDESKPKHSPCLLASLLFIARQLFLFQPSRLRDEDEDPCESLIKMSIQLLSHPSKEIASEGSKLLFYTFLYDQGNHIDQYARQLCSGILAVVEKTGAFPALSDLIGLLSQQIPQYGLLLFNKIFEKLRAQSTSECDRRIITAISLNCPIIAARNLNQLVALQDANMDIVVSTLASRQARFSPPQDDKVSRTVSAFMERDDVNYWVKYKVGRHALMTGNFQVALSAFNLISETVVDEKYFLWISALMKMAESDAILCEKATLGIPAAVQGHTEALFRMRSLQSFADGEEYSFQIRFLILRLDFLDLITLLRQTTRETRLTRLSPAKYTRTYKYLVNAVKALEILSGRCNELIRRYGIHFRHGQSRSALMVMQRLASFIGQFCRAVFSDVLPSRKKDTKEISFRGYNHPMAVLINRLGELVLNPVQNCPDPKARALTMLELLDSILMTPFPLPRDFFLPKPIPSGELHLLRNPSHFGNNTADHIDTGPMIGFTLHAFGRLPGCLMKPRSVPVWTILLWFRITYCGPLVLDEDAGGGDNNGDDSRQEEVGQPRIPDVSGFSPWMAPVSTNGQFSGDVEFSPFPDEGLYEIEAKLGCTDATGASWNISTSTQTSRITVTVSRSLL